MKTRFALWLLAFTLLGCAPSKPSLPSKVNYLWTLSSVQGEAALGPQSQPAPDQPLRLRVATDSQPARVLVATFQDQVLCIAPPPVLVELPANSEQVIQWQVPSGQKGSKVFTAFLPAAGESSREVEGLLKQLSEPKAESGAAAQRLYARLSEWAGQDRSGSASAGHQVVELGAALSTSLMSPEASPPESGGGRASSKDTVSPQGKATSALVDWRKVSREVSVGDDVHPVVIYDFATAPR